MHIVVPLVSTLLFQVIVIGLFYVFETNPWILLLAVLPPLITALFISSRLYLISAGISVVAAIAALFLITMTSPIALAVIGGCSLVTVILAELIHRQAQQRTRAERDQQAADERFRDLFEQLPTAAALERNGSLLYVNPAWVSLFGSSSAREIYHQPFENFVAPVSAEKRRQSHASLDIGGTPSIAYESIALHANGNQFPVHVEISTLRLDDGAAQLLFLTNLSERHKAAAKLRAHEEQFRLTFDLAPVGIALTTPTGQILHANSAFCRTLGYTADEMRQRTINDISHADDIEANETLRSYLLDGTTTHFQIEKRYVRKDGTLVPCLFKATLIRDIDGRPQQLIGQIVDLTERKELEEERLSLERTLQESQRLESLGMLAGGIAHDFNNLLTAISGNAQIALLDIDETSSTHEPLTNIMRTVDRASELTRQLLAYAGRSKLAIAQINVNSAIESTLQILRTSISKQITLKQRLNADLPTIEGDPAQLNQVIMNLVINAAQAIGEEPGSIEISTGLNDIVQVAANIPHQINQLAPGRYVYVEISDTGCGMDAETLNRIFQPFFTTKPQGNGLGLAAVQGILRRHNGDLRVRSTKGVGTTFTILLPITQVGEPSLPTDEQLPTHPRSAQQATPRSGDQVVLIVDDEAGIRELSRRILQSAGYSVLTADNGDEGLAIFQRHAEQIGCVLLDLTMPGTTGQAVLQQILRENDSVKVILMSGYVAEAEEQALRRLGAYDIIRKPFQNDLLESKVRSAFTSQLVVEIG
jgi:PAS domain S-box-containing protein